MDRLTADRAQSESIGVLLLVAVVVISISTFGVYYLASTTDGSAGSAVGDIGTAEVDLELSATTDELAISHNGGESITTDGLQVRIENASGEYTYDFEEDALRGDGNGQFDPGESWRLRWNKLKNTEVTVSLVNDDGEVVFRDSVTIEPPMTKRPANPAS